MNIQTIEKDDLPERLLEIPEPPSRLYIQGAPLPEDLTYISFVGSRKCSPYGRESCEHLIYGLRHAPVAIVSGLALGVDGYAHQAALDAGLYTVAIPGSGLGPNTLYPSSHRQLAQEIIASGGTLLSEFEPSFKATPWAFPQRNRIMAGLSHAIVIVEAEMKSGTLITARLALDYNREVFAVPGSIFSPLSDGPLYLIRNGATPTRSADDILEGLSLPTDENVSEKIDLTPEEERVLAFLTYPLERDELVNKLNIPIGVATSLLMGMEIKGLIKEVGGEICKTS